MILFGNDENDDDDNDGDENNDDDNDDDGLVYFRDFNCTMSMR